MQIREKTGHLAALVFPGYTDNPKPARNKKIIFQLKGGFYFFKKSSVIAVGKC